MGVDKSHVYVYWELYESGRELHSRDRGRKDSYI